MISPAAAHLNNSPHLVGAVAGFLPVWLLVVSMDDITVTRVMPKSACFAALSLLSREVPVSDGVRQPYAACVEAENA